MNREVSCRYWSASRYLEGRRTNILATFGHNGKIDLVKSAHIFWQKASSEQDRFNFLCKYGELHVFPASVRDRQYLLPMKIL